MSSENAIAGVPTPSSYEALLALDPSVFEAIPAAVCICSADGAIVRFNRRATELWGRTPLGAASDERFCGAFRLFRRDGQPLPRDKTPMEAALRAGEAQRGKEVVIERPDGSRVVALNNIEPLKAPSGAVQGAINCFQDITEQKRAEQEVRASRSDLEDFFENAVVPIHWVDGNGIILRANQAELDLLGYASEEYVGRHIADFHADRATIDDILGRLSRGEKLDKYAARLRAKDGTIRHVLINSSARFRGREFLNTRCLTLDVTAEQARQELASIVESSHDAIVSVDLNGTIVSWNAGAERLYGYSAGEIVGKAVTVLLPEDRQAEETSILSQIRDGKRVEHYETVRRCKDGGFVDVSLSVSPVKGAAGNVVGASKIARDMSERKRAEEALSRRIDEQAALYQFTDSLHRAQSLDEVYDSGLTAIVRALICQRASILLFDATGVMRFVAWTGLSDAYRKAVDGHSPWTPDADSPEPICIDDIDNADIPDSLKSTIRGEGIGALAFIPLVARGRTIGKFMAYYDGPHVFTEAEVDLAVAVARQLSFGVERMRAEQGRRRAEDDLRESEGRLEFALTAGQMGAWEWNLESGSVIWSPVLERIHGLEPGNFGGQFEDFKRDIHPEDVNRVLAQIERTTKTGGEYRVEYRLPPCDGTERWLEARGRLVRGADGRPRKLAGVCMEITERKEAEKERNLLVAELSHRVKNTLATVISVAQQSFARADSLDEARRSFQARIRALAQTHGHLAEANWSGISFATMLQAELAPYRDGANVRISGPAIRLNARCALTLGMAIHELATNAAKHGALSKCNGSVDVAWEVDPDKRLRIHWTEAGGPPVTRPATSGFGRLLLERALTSDLGGDVQLDFAEPGLKCCIAIPLEEHAAHPLLATHGLG